MTADELVAAVQPCLPLPGITVAFLSSDARKHICLGDDDGFETLVLADAARIVKGAIADACAERRWSVTQGLTTTTIVVRDPNGLKLARSFFTDGTDAIAWCHAYRMAKEATDG